jgi:sugar/nucleoside kinase (ribokinase family)
MMETTFRISGTGCALVDYLYKPVSFTDETFSRYLSVKPGDGGLSPGKLVFREEFEKFSGEEYHIARERITKGKPPVAMNIGGPSIVSLIHAAQMLTGRPAKVRFYGSKGRDEGAAFIEERLQQTPLEIGKYKTVSQNTPFTDVLSDPDFDHGHGERIFINTIGAAWELFPEDLGEAFFESDLVVFGGTALTPNLHRPLLELLRKAKDNHAITVVNTVYDFLNEKKNPAAPWPLGESEETYRYIDLLITDMEEALRLSGQQTVDEALAFFKNRGAGAVVVTHGANPVHYFSESRLFGSSEGSKPVSAKIKETIVRNPEQVGDTTGCGDNFVGGMIASIAEQQMDRPDRPVDPEEAIAFGVASGGYACFYHGGTFFEEFPGQKRQLLEPYLRDYRLQTGKM